MSFPPVAECHSIAIDPNFFFILLEHLARGAHGELAINGRQNRGVEQDKSRRYRRIDNAPDHIAERTMRTEHAVHGADAHHDENGRAWYGERVCQYVELTGCGVILNKKNS